MALKLGTWKINVNGIVFDLNITAIDANGVINGNTAGPSVATPIAGLYDETSRRIVFQNYLVGGVYVVKNFPTFEGYLFSTPLVPPLGQDILWTMAGIGIVPGTDINPFVPAPTAKRSVLGWFAQITEVV